MILVFIIVGMYILMYILLKGELKKENKLKNIIIVGLVIETILLIIYRLDLYYLGREVYFSDAETYWRETLELIKYGVTSGYNSLYYKMGYLIQKMSPFIWSGWNNIFNISCINLSLVIIVKVFFNDKVDIKKIKLLIISVVYNPFIIYGLMRNLKDAMFMLMVYIVAFLYYELCRTKKILTGIICLLTILLFSYLFTTIRPWGFLISFLALILYIIRNAVLKFNKFNFEINIRKILIYLAVIILIIPIIYKAYPIILNNIKIWYPIVKKSFLQKDLITAVLGVVRFVLAPGPIRSLMGSKYFLHYTVSGNIMCFIGSIMWWVSLVIMGANVLLQKERIKKVKDSQFILFLIATTITYILIYVNQYNGVAEIRLRSVLYVFVYSIFFYLFDILKINDNKKKYIVYIFFGIVILCITVFVGMK